MNPIYIPAADLFLELAERFAREDAAKEQATEPNIQEVKTA